MLIYNITIKADNNIVVGWLQWQKEIYIPEVPGSGVFYEQRFFELPVQDEPDGKTFAV